MDGKRRAQEGQTGRSTRKTDAVEGSGVRTGASVRPTRSWWLIAKDGEPGTEPLAIERRGERVLPVFGFREEAQMFLRLGALGDGWRVTETGGGELVSALGGPRAKFKKVALDPLPLAVGGEALVDLPSMDGETFRRKLIGGRWPVRKRQDPGSPADRSCSTDDGVSAARRGAPRV
jgi:hypothetical protein